MTRHLSENFNGRKEKVLKLSVLSESSGVKSHIAVTSQLADMAPGQVIWKGNNSLQGQKKIKEH